MPLQNPRFVVLTPTGLVFRNQHFGAFLYIPYYYLSKEFEQTDLSKQCRFESDVECGIKSDPTLFATYPAIFLHENWQFIGCSNLRVSMVSCYCV